MNSWYMVGTASSLFVFAVDGTFKILGTLWPKLCSRLTMYSPSDQQSRKVTCIKFCINIELQAYIKFLGKLWACSQLTFAQVALLNSCSLEGH